MKRFSQLFLLASILIPMMGFAQQNCREATPSAPGGVMVIDGSEVPDFTITDSEGQTRNLYEQLANGKTVILDLFMTT